MLQLIYFKLNKSVNFAVMACRANSFLTGSEVFIPCKLTDGPRSIYTVCPLFSLLIFSPIPWNGQQFIIATWEVIRNVAFRLNRYWDTAIHVNEGNLPPPSSFYISVCSLWAPFQAKSSVVEAAFYHSPLFITVALFRIHGTCVYIITCASPHVRSVGGEVRFFRPSSSSTGQRQTIKKATDSEAVSAASLSLNHCWPARGLKWMWSIIIFMKLQGSWAELKQSRIWLNWPLLPTALRVKTAKKGTDEAQMACVTEDGCGWVGGLKLIMKATYFTVLTVLMIFEITAFVPSADHAHWSTFHGWNESSDVAK